jgi:hypothetical protein
VRDGRKGKPKECEKTNRVATCAEDGFEVTMLFNHDVGMRIERKGGVVYHVEEGGKVGPKRGSELGTTVRGDSERNTKAGNPGGTEGMGTGRRRRGGKGRNSLNSASGPVDHGEDVGMTLRRKKRTNEVKMVVGKKGE